MHFPINRILMGITLLILTITTSVAAPTRTQPTSVPERLPPKADQALKGFAYFGAKNGTRPAEPTRAASNQHSGVPKSTQFTNRTMTLSMPKNVTTCLPAPTSTATNHRLGVPKVDAVKAHPDGWVQTDDTEGDLTGGPDKVSEDVVSSSKKHPDGWVQSEHTEGDLLDQKPPAEKAGH